MTSDEPHDPPPEDDGAAAIDRAFKDAETVSDEPPQSSSGRSEGAEQGGKGRSQAASGRSEGTERGDKEPPDLLPPDSVGDDDEFAPRSTRAGGEDGKLRLPCGRVVNDALLRQIRANASEPPTDIGNGRRFLAMHGEDALYVPNLGWFLFDGTRWKQCETLDPVRILVHRVAETIELEARFFHPSAAQQAVLDLGDQAAEMIGPLEAKRRAKGQSLSADEQAQFDEFRAAISEAVAMRKRLADARQARRKYGRSSQNKNKLTAMMEEARPYIAKEVGMLDADPLAINVANGSLRMVRGGSNAHPWVPELVPHAREQFHTKIATAAFDENAECPSFLTFLERIVPDEEVRDFLKRWFGYVLTGRTSEEVFVFFYGEGANGKSTLVDVIAKILGDYCVTVPFATLAGDDKRRGDSATPDLVRLPGARMVRAAEPEKGVKLKEAEVKALTGGEAILIRKMREEFVELDPEFKLVLSGNHEPAINGNDYGIWRRTLLVPFTQEIPEDQRDKGLKARLLEERDGIFAWMVAGLLEYLERDGLHPPEGVLKATAAYRESQDPLTNFVHAAFEFPQSDETCEEQHSPKTLYETYLRWCEMANEKPFAQKTFSTGINKMLPKLGATRPKVNGIYMQKGFWIRDVFRPTPTTDGPPGEGHPSEGPPTDYDADEIPY